MLFGAMDCMLTRCKDLLHELDTNLTGDIKYLGCRKCSNVG